MTIQLQRLDGWPERLSEYLRRHRATPFSWGPHDCARFAAGAVQTITGRDVLSVSWADRAQAVAVLRASGGLIAAVDEVLPRLAGPQWAQRGDVLLVLDAESGRRWLAVADGSRWWAPASGGMSWGHTAQAVQAWGVAHA